MNEVTVKDRVIEGSFVLDEPAEPNIVKTNCTIRLVQFSKLPGSVEIKAGKKISDLVSEGLIVPGQHYHVNGQLVGEDYVLQDGDGLVAAPRVAGGQI